MIKMDVILNSLTLQQLPKKDQEVAEIIGLESYINLCKALGGSPIYLPTIKNLVVDNVRQRINKELKILSPQQLSLKYGVSLSTVYRIRKEIGE